MNADFLDFFSGIVGGCSGTIVGHPLDTLKTRLQIDLTHKSTIKTLKGIIKHEGVKGLYKGISAPLIGSTLVNRFLK